MKTRAANFLALLGCIGIGILAGAGAIGLSWVFRLHLNSKQQMVALCGFTLMGLIYGVVIATSTPQMTSLRRFRK